jgi:hypothetical protein
LEARQLADSKSREAGLNGYLDPSFFVIRKSLLKREQRIFQVHQEEILTHFAGSIC